MRALDQAVLADDDPLDLEQRVLEQLGVVATYGVGEGGDIGHRWFVRSVRWRSYGASWSSTGEHGGARCGRAVRVLWAWHGFGLSAG